MSAPVPVSVSTGINSRDRTMPAYGAHGGFDGPGLPLSLPSDIFIAEGSFSLTFIA